MHPLLRNTVIGIVGLIIAGALAALALLGIGVVLRRRGVRRAD